MQINANNIAKALPEEILDFFHERYDSLEIPKTIETYNLSQVEQMLSFIANEKTYLNYLLTVADIQSRYVKQGGTKSDIDDAISKKNIIKAYISTLDSLNKALSRMITVYQIEKEDIRSEDRLLNAGIA